MFEGLADALALMGLDEADDVHRPATFEAPQRIGLVDPLDQYCPVQSRRALLEVGGDDFRCCCILAWVLRT